jgi:hypothetical protein
MDVQSIANHVLPIFEAHKNEGNIEVEIRLGKHNGSLFDTNVGKDTWKRVLKGLKKYNGWESVRPLQLMCTTTTTTTSESHLMRNLVNKR